MKSCLLTIIVYLLTIQCIKLFNYVCFNAFDPFLRELCCVAYRLAASVKCKQSSNQTRQGPRQDGSAVLKVAQFKQIF